MESTEFKILTLNCWGLPVASKDKAPRMQAIATFLATNEYDFVCLQEVWLCADFNRMRDKIIAAYPYSHYFHSGVFGSGICIFSKHPLEDVFFHQWAVNGYVHKLQHGDWFGGKGVGLCCIRVNNYIINVYSAHLHAEYNRDNDEYEAHRVLQAFDIAQFIQLTSGHADLAILGGDLNTEPGDLAYRVITCLTGLHDTFTEVLDSDKDHLFTSETPTNSYTPSSSKPPGKRIDFLLYFTSSKINAAVKTLQCPLPNRVPGCMFSYSDHEAVTATLAIDGQHIKKEACDVTDKISALEECIVICDSALKHLYYKKRMYGFLCAFMFMIVISIVVVDASYNLRVVFHTLKLIVTALMCYTFIMATLWNMIEKNALLAGRLAMQVMLKRCQCEEQDASSKNLV